MFKWKLLFFRQQLNSEKWDSTSTLTCFRLSSVVFMCSAVSGAWKNGAQNRWHVDYHLLHVFDSVSAIVENGGNVTEGGIGPVQAVIKGQQVVRLSDALVHQHRAASAIHQALHNSRRTSPCAVEQQPWKKQTEKKIPFIMHFVRIPKCWRTAALEKQIGKKIPSIMLLCTS